MGCSRFPIVNEAELAFDPDLVTVPRHVRIGPDFDRRAIRADARERQRRHHIDVGGESRGRVARRALEDAEGRLYSLHGNPVLDEIGRAGETSGGLRVTICTEVMVPSAAAETASKPINAPVGTMI